MFATALQSIVMMAELAIRGPEKFQKRVFWKGLEILEEIRHNNRNVIFWFPMAGAWIFLQCCWQLREKNGRHVSSATKSSD